MKQTNNDKWKEFDTIQEVCPQCGSDNLDNVELDDLGREQVTCHDCGCQWTEPPSE